MIPTELDNTFDVSSKTFSASNDCCEYMDMIANRRANIPAAASRVHLSDDDVSLLPDFILGKSFEMPTTHHPRISVVTAVETACAAYGELMNMSRIEAPTVPKR